MKHISPDYSLAARRYPNATDFGSGTARAVRCCARKLVKTIGLASSGKSLISL